MNAELDWSDLDLLRRVAEGGTLSAAARALHVDQTTASRRLARIEAQIGQPLFDRVRLKLVPTPLLADALPHLATMAEAAGRTGVTLAASRVALRGVVRVTSVGLIQSFMLAPALADFAAAHPGITLDLGVEDQNLSFEKREADVALRLGRGPEDHALITRLGALRFRLYRPMDTEGPRPIVAYHEALAETPEMRLLARLRPGAEIIARSNQIEVLWRAALATGAEVMAPDILGDGDSRFRRSEDDGLVAEREVFRLSHPARAREPNVAAVIRWIDRTVRIRLG
jgi:DNA-binding transcriptional LysR family regulator